MKYLRTFCSDCNAMAVHYEDMHGQIHCIHDKDIIDEVADQVARDLGYILPDYIAESGELMNKANWHGKIIS